MSVLNLSGDEAPEVRRGLTLNSLNSLLSVSALYGVPRNGRYQLLPLHLRLPGLARPQRPHPVLTFHVQICRFCWNKLRTEGNGLCPACRQAYTENPADFKPLTSEEMAKIKV